MLIFKWYKTFFFKHNRLQICSPDRQSHDFLRTTTLKSNQCQASNRSQLFITIFFFIISKSQKLFYLQNNFSSRSIIKNELEFPPEKLKLTIERYWSVPPVRRRCRGVDDTRARVPDAGSTVREWWASPSRPRSRRGREATGTSGDHRVSVSLTRLLPGSRPDRSVAPRATGSGTAVAGWGVAVGSLDTILMLWWNIFLCKVIVLIIIVAIVLIVVGKTSVSRNKKSRSQLINQLNMTILFLIQKYLNIFNLSFFS